MEIERLSSYDLLSQKHWWLTSKYLLLLDLLKTQIPDGTKLDPLLDVGCSSGFFLKHLKAFSNIRYGIDKNPEILKIRNDTDAILKSADAKKIPFHNKMFSLITAIDVIEHIEDDTQSLKEFNRLLRPEGWLLLCVPAFMLLFGKHDQLFGHYRRYCSKDLRSKLEACGFTIKKISYIQPLFFLPLLIKRKLFPIKNELLGDFSLPPKFLNTLLHYFILLEKYPLRYIDFPFGATLICLSQKICSKS